MEPCLFGPAFAACRPGRFKVSEQAPCPEMRDRLPLRPDGTWRLERSDAENPAAAVEYSAEDSPDQPHGLWYVRPRTQGTGLKTSKDGSERRQASLMSGT